MLRLICVNISPSVIEALQALNSCFLGYYYKVYRALGDRRQKSLL